MQRPGSDIRATRRYALDGQSPPSCAVLSQHLVEMGWQPDPCATATVTPAGDLALRFQRRCSSFVVYGYIFVTIDSKSELLDHTIEVELHTDYPAASDVDSGTC